MIRWTRSRVTKGPSSRVTLLCSHCQTWDRAISAVAASSIRLKIATAPLPPSQVARYCRATLTSLRSPASVITPGVLSTASRSGPVTLTSSRSRSSWLGRSPSAASKTSLHNATRSGWATQEPSKPSPDSRVLSSRTLASAVAVTSGSRRFGMNAAIPPIARAPAVAGLDQQLGVGAHERRRHRDRVALGQDELPAPGPELLDDAEQVVP